MNKHLKVVLLSICMSVPFCTLALIDLLKKEENKKTFPIVYKTYSDKLDLEFNDYSYPFMENCFFNKHFGKDHDKTIKFCAEEYINLSNQLEEQKKRNIEFSKANLNYYPIRK